MGGTFISTSEAYPGKFIAQLYNALSGFTGTDVRSELSLFANTRFLIPVVADILSRANRKLSTIKTGPGYCAPISGLSDIQSEITIDAK